MTDIQMFVYNVTHLGEYFHSHPLVALWAPIILAIMSLLGAYIEHIDPVIRAIAPIVTTCAGLMGAYASWLFIKKLRNEKS